MNTIRNGSAGAQTRRRYDEQFKKHAVELTLQAGRTVPAVAVELGLNENMLYRWRRRYAPPPGGGGGAARTVAELEAEVRRLRAEVVRMQQREHILKKSLGILSEPPESGMPGSRP